MSLEITKARLINKGNDGMEITYIETLEGGRKIKYPKVEFSDPVHGSLKKCFDALAPHAALIFGIVKKEQVEDITRPDKSLFAPFTCHIYTIGGKGELPGVTLSGSYEPEPGGINNFNARFRLFDEKPETRYAYMDDLQQKLKILDAKIKLYMRGEELGTKQLDAFADNENGNKITKMHIEKPAGKEVNTGGIGHADPEAMNRVKEWTPGGYLQEMNNGGQEAHQEGQGAPTEVLSPAGKRKVGRPKRVAQSPAAPGGIIDEENQSNQG